MVLSQGGTFDGERINKTSVAITSANIRLWQPIPDSTAPLSGGTFALADIEIFCNPDFNAAAAVASAAALASAATLADAASLADAAPAPAPAMSASSAGVCTTAPGGVTSVATAAELESLFSSVDRGDSCAKEVTLDATAEYASTDAWLSAVVTD